ncbi:MAG: cytochrome C oxidase subunit IV family protein [Vicinamibacterales bacterium]|nr:cytochrome C oxidase subunit IV family protein [Vicinamibacterales bacterium]
MSDATYQAETRAYLTTLGALLALTVVTVALSYLDLPTAPTVALALAVASLKAALVAAVFMHLKGEHALVYGTLVLTAVLVVVLFVLLLGADADRLFGTGFGDAFSEGPR